MFRDFFVKLLLYYCFCIYSIYNLNNFHVLIEIVMNN